MYNPKSVKAEEFIDHQEVLESLEEASRESANPQRVLQILEKAALCKGITHREAAILMECRDLELEEKIYALAAQIKQQFYGNRIVLFAPLYLSNYCVTAVSIALTIIRTRPFPARSYLRKRLPKKCAHLSAQAINDWLWKLEKTL